MTSEYKNLLILYTYNRLTHGDTTHKKRLSFHHKYSTLISLKYVIM